MSPVKHPKKIKPKEKKMAPPKEAVGIEKRKRPRFDLELPIDYFRIDTKENYGGIVANASELGILVYLPERIEMGTALSTEIFYAKGLELDSIKAVGKVVRTDLTGKKTWGEHRYGLQFQAIDKQNLGKLKNLLKEAGKAKNQKK